MITCEVNEAFLKLVLNTLVQNELRPKDIPAEFIEVDTLLYQDNGKEKIAVFVAFLQDYQKPDNTLDEYILKKLVAEVEERDLTSVVSDISVNLWQWKNKKIVFSPILEEGLV